MAVAAVAATAAVVMAALGKRLASVGVEAASSAPTKGLFSSTCCTFSSSPGRGSNITACPTSNLSACSSVMPLLPNTPLAVYISTLSAVAD